MNMTLIDSLPSSLPMQVVAAYLGTLAFALLFGVPRRYFWLGGICGVLSWMPYLLLVRYTGASTVEASFVGTVLATFASRLFAIRKHCPVTVFLISSLIPLVPGAGIFRTAYYMVSDQMSQAMNSGLIAIKVVIAIVLGIVIVTEIPQKFFVMLALPCHHTDKHPHPKAESMLPKNEAGRKL